ncbi:MAG: EAL domain-containing protein, partial [Clostridiales bacterium]|nr:EAL domain-containing protein [Clostridiales bacterium]
MSGKKQILIVEDNELNRAILSEILSSEYQVLEAENGQVALDILNQYKDSVSLILLDVTMPVMDGYTFLNRIMEDPELSLIPVIMTPQTDNEVDEIMALSHGATDFVPKPYRPQIILHRIASLIKLRETAAMVNQFQYDRLTGLYSKEFFYQKVRERLMEEPEQEYCIICSNIENFKLVNDIFGPREGDRLLIEVANIAKNMVGRTGFCGRFTADRFLCFQKKEQEQSDRQNFGKFHEQKPSPLLKSVVMRWGIYEITDRSIPVEQMCDRALLAADSIKGQYNQFFAVYDDSLRRKLLREKAITDAIETALTEEQFVIYLQPKYRIMDGCMAGAEALVRWQHPEWGFMAPKEFIPLLEKNGYISHLDQYVWEKTCIQLREWQDKGYPPLPVSVNVSRADMYQLDLTEVLSKLTQKYGIAPEYLHLEITESIYAEDPNQIINTVEQLRELGFVVEMDDFGSGYSSLNMLS